MKTVIASMYDLTDETQLHLVFGDGKGEADEFTFYVPKRVDAAEDRLEVLAQLIEQLQLAWEDLAYDGD